MPPAIKLMDILSNYQGFRKICVIVVFDAYKVSGRCRERSRNITTSTLCIQKKRRPQTSTSKKVAIRIGRRYRTTVATSDGVIQLIIRSQGCILWSARDFREEIERVGKLISEEKRKAHRQCKNYLFAHADEETKVFRSRPPRKKSRNSIKKECALAHFAPRAVACDSLIFARVRIFGTSVPFSDLPSFPSPTHSAGESSGTDALCRSLASSSLVGECVGGQAALV